MVDWLTWPAELFLSAGGIIAWLEIGGRVLIELPNAVFDALLPSSLPATMDD